MNLQYRIDLLARLGHYILQNDPEWQDIKERASRENGWFILPFVERATQQIAEAYLQKSALDTWTLPYNLPSIQEKPRTVGLVMAGNIPLVGFHDFLCLFISGHHGRIKTSSKDEILFKHLFSKLVEWVPQVGELFQFAEMLRNCDAYIATGSNNSAGYFEYYFSKYPNIIRRNRTSVAILTGNETPAMLDSLADDVYLYFGLGCRNVTKIYVPDGYDFIPLINQFKKYDFLADHHKYKNNFDYNLSLHLLNKKYYMSNSSLLLIEEKGMFSPISQLNYEFYNDSDKMTESLQQHPDLQSIVGNGHVPFGHSQFPSLIDYADGVDTLEFLKNLNKNSF